jgi:hypothetical protein
MRLYRAVLIALSIPTLTANAQSEMALRRAFEGKTVVLRIDMPGTSGGVNLTPGAWIPVNFSEVADRLKRYGTAIRIGETVMVTKVKVKNDLIEFHLGGGGYGTFGDNTGSTASHTNVEETQAEKALADSIQHTSSVGRKARMQRDLDQLRATRQRENDRAAAEAAQAAEARESNLRNRRIEGGSRFNIRFRHGIPSNALTPEGIRAILGEYVDFSGDGNVAVEPNPAPTGAVGGLRKGMLLAEVESLLGPARTAEESVDCALKVMIRNYLANGQRTTARFVSGVLVDYTISAE